MREFGPGGRGRSSPNTVLSIEMKKSRVSDMDEKQNRSMLLYL